MLGHLVGLPLALSSEDDLDIADLAVIDAVFGGRAEVPAIDGGSFGGHVGLLGGGVGLGGDLIVFF